MSKAENGQGGGGRAALGVEQLGGFGEALKELRWRARMKQVEVCRATGMTAPQVSRYENGHEMPTVESLVRYLGAVGADLCELQRVLVGEAPTAPVAPAEGEGSDRRREMGRGVAVGGGQGLGQVLGGLTEFALESVERFEGLEERVRVLEEELAGLKV